MKTARFLILVLAAALLVACSSTSTTDNTPPTGRGDPNGGTVASGTSLHYGPGVGLSSDGY